MFDPLFQAKTPYNFANKGYLSFENITCVPIQNKMVDTSILSREELDWLNAYNANCRDKVSLSMKCHGKDFIFCQLHPFFEPGTPTYDWLSSSTAPLIA
jgi:hypothetical protein